MTDEIDKIVAAECGENKKQKGEKTYEKAVDSDAGACAVHADLCGCGRNEIPQWCRNLYLPWDAGGSSDATVRQIAELFNKATGANTAVENQAGAGGTVATTDFKNSTPDGQSICLEAIGVFTLQPFTREVGYTSDDFIPVCSLTTEPIILLAARIPASPVWKMSRTVAMSSTVPTAPAP